MIILIPIFSDAFLHPLHKDNDLSLLYVRHVGDKESIDEIKNDHTSFYITPDVKKIKHLFPDTRLIDVNYLHWNDKNVPMDLENIRVNSYDFFHTKYYNIKKLNEIIPISKHKEYCDRVFDKIVEYIDTVYESKYHSDVINAFHSIENNGVKVSDDVCDIFDVRVKKHISDGKLYSNYNLTTTTGRPSNSFGTVNFAALPPEKRTAIIPENDYLVDFDFDAYHLRLIGNLVGFDFDSGDWGGKSVHEYFAYRYGCSYEESKQKTFQILYGGIREEHSKISSFFPKTLDYINKKWREINTHNLVYTDIYRRKLLFKNYDDLNRNKLFNYLIQAYETESNIKKILSIQDYLYDKKTKLVLYGYDSFLFDFSKQDGVEILTEIKNILERENQLTKSKMGLNYGEMNDITKRL